MRPFLAGVLMIVHQGWECVHDKEKTVQILLKTYQIIWQSNNYDTSKHHQTSGKICHPTSGQKPGFDSNVVSSGTWKIQDKAHPKDLENKINQLILRVNFQKWAGSVDWIQRTK